MMTRRAWHKAEFNKPDTNSRREEHESQVRSMDGQRQTLVASQWIVCPVGKQSRSAPVALCCSATLAFAVEELLKSFFCFQLVLAVRFLDPRPNPVAVGMSA